MSYPEAITHWGTRLAYDVAKMSNPKLSDEAILAIIEKCRAPPKAAPVETPESIQRAKVRARRDAIRKKHEDDPDALAAALKQDAIDNKVVLTQAEKVARLEAQLEAMKNPKAKADPKPKKEPKAKAEPKKAKAEKPKAKVEKPKAEKPKAKVEKPKAAESDSEDELV